MKKTTALFAALGVASNIYAAFVAERPAAGELVPARELWTIDGNVRYTEYPGVDHDSWVPLYSDWKNFAWFFSQSRRQAEERTCK